MSTIQRIQSKFEKMGARASIRNMTRASFQRYRRPLVIDVVRRGGREVFDIEKTVDVQLAVMDVQSRHRHLLMSAENSAGKDRFLCGHDERHWFVAALPEGSGPRTVDEAKDSLKPQLVKTREQRRRRGKKRRTADVYLRQGEWFFVPRPNASINPAMIVRNAPLVRGPGSKPHFCELLYLDGEREYVCDRFPKLAFFESEYKKILKTRRKSSQWNWRPLPFEPDVYVRSQITHEDHNPLYLNCWHRVEINTESQGSALVRVIYRD